MNSDQLPIEETEIISQAEATRRAHVTRAVIKGAVERGDLLVADRGGVRETARLFAGDVDRWKAARDSRGGSQSPGTSAVECPGCRPERRRRLRAEEKVQKQEDVIRRLKKVIRALSSLDDDED